MKFGITEILYSIMIVPTVIGIAFGIWFYTQL